MKEWFSNNKNWVSWITLFLLLMGALWRFQMEYVTEKRYYNYNKEQDATTQRLATLVELNSKQISANRADIAENTAILDLIKDSA